MRGVHTQKTTQSPPHGGSSALYPLEQQTSGERSIASEYHGHQNKQFNKAECEPLKRTITAEQWLIKREP